MEKRFIVLVDLSPKSENLVRFTHQWSLETDSSLLLLHQTHGLVTGRLPDEKWEAMNRRHVNELEDDLRDMCIRILPATAKVRFHVTGMPVHLAVEGLKSESFDDIVVVGLKGTGTLKKFTIGSVAVDVMGSVEGVVAAIPLGLESFRPRKLHVAVAPSHPFDLDRFRDLLGFFGSDKPILRFFTVIKPYEQREEAEQTLTQLASAFAGYESSCDAVIEEEEALERLAEQVSDASEEMLVLQRGSRQFSDRVFRTFFIDELAYAGKTPLLVLP